MNGIHDMGGMDGFGPVLPEANEPVFHAEWERRMFAISLAVPFSVPFTDDHLRREVERIPPEKYLSSSYYERWLLAIESLLRERGVTAAMPPVVPSPALRDADVAAAIASGVSTRRPEGGMTARFRPGDAVVARNIHPAGHTRLPRYVRGKHGVVGNVHGVFTFADSNAKGEGEQPQHLYCVRFAARELWGDVASPHDALYLDLWESYLEPP